MNEESSRAPTSLDVRPSLSDDALTMRISPSLLLLALLAASFAAWAGDDRLFLGHVAPVLEQRCVRCHGESSPKAKLSLATLRGMLQGGEGGPAVEPGKPDESLLIEMISGD